jgi:hypothetical protein
MNCQQVLSEDLIRCCLACERFGIDNYSTMLDKVIIKRKVREYLIKKYGYTMNQASTILIVYTKIGKDSDL